MRYLDDLFLIVGSSCHPLSVFNGGTVSAFCNNHDSIVLYYMVIINT